MTCCWLLLGCKNNDTHSGVGRLKQNRLPDARVHVTRNFSYTSFGEALSDLPSGGAFVLCGVRKHKALCAQKWCRRVNEHYPRPWWLLGAKTEKQRVLSGFLVKAEFAMIPALQFSVTIFIVKQHDQIDSFHAQVCQRPRFSTLISSQFDARIGEFPSATPESDARMIMSGRLVLSADLARCWSNHRIVVPVDLFRI
jgi:hypothetical protein